VAAALGKTTAALNKWEERGDGMRRGATTAQTIVAAISQLAACEIPAAALQAGSRFWPGWQEETP